MSRRVRILIVYDHIGYPPDGIHGGTTYIASVLPRLDESRFEVRMVCTRYEHEAGAALLKERAGLEIEYLTRSKYDPRTILDIAALVRRWQPDILHLAQMRSIVAGRIVGWLYSVPTIAHIHDGVPLPLWFRFLARLSGKLGTATAICVSESVKDNAINGFGTNPAQTHVLMNGIDVDYFASGERERTRAQLGYGSDAFVVGVSSRLMPGKGHKVLLDALALAKQRDVQIQALIIGDGSLRAELETHAKAVGIDGSTLFLGHRTDLPDLLAAIDVLVIPSIHNNEGCPISILEAGAAGKPIVGFKVPGVVDIIHDSVEGLLGPRGSAEWLAEALIRLAQEPQTVEKFGAAAQQRIQEFSIQNHVKKLQQIFLDHVDELRSS